MNTVEIEEKYRVLPNGNMIPTLGIGTDRVSEGSDVVNEIVWAIKAGYRHIDTAYIYHNERGVGHGIEQCIKEGIVKREDLFVTTKVHKTRRGYEQTLEVFNESLEKLKLDYIDLYLIHSPHRESTEWKEEVIDTWRAMEKLYKEGKIKALGVSNFGIVHLKYLLEKAEIKPVVNQLELHPQHQQREVVEFCRQNNIALESWSALNQGRVFDIKLFREIAAKYNKSVSQVCLRWNFQEGFIPLTRSIKKEHIEDNFNIFDFKLSTKDMEYIDALDGGAFSGMHYDEEWTGIIKRSLLNDFYLNFYKPYLEGYNPKCYNQEFMLFNSIPIFQLRKYNYETTKYYLFGINFMTKKTYPIDERRQSLLQFVFSIRNSENNDGKTKHKVITILGIKLKIKVKSKANE